ncbi:MAG: class I SAM-dependent methyltransferase [Rhizobiales bacterium]|nr:class I SAM-dependent methyltransferase [Hyphomicrobiales bacterium]
MSSAYTYEGSELELFSKAHNWKTYWSSFLHSYLGEDVLDVGAGIGATAAVLCGNAQKSWTALEPDKNLATGLLERQRAQSVPASCTVRVGTISDLGASELFDSVLYIDVLEHIGDDHKEFNSAAQHLKPDGHLIVLAPAHQFLFSPFDKSVGHYRRYDIRSMAALHADGLKPIKLHYLDAMGMIASSANRFLLRSGMPTASQIAIWDRLMVPTSRIIDPLLGYRLGKSILGIWQKHL